MDEIDIAMDAGWDGDPEKFVNGLIKAGFLEKRDNVFILHDWKDHQPFITTLPERRQKAREAAQARWEKKDAKKAENADRIKNQCETHKKTMRDASISHAPTPTIKQQNKHFSNTIPEKYINRLLCNVSA